MALDRNCSVSMDNTMTKQNEIGMTKSDTNPGPISAYTDTIKEGGEKYSQIQSARTPGFVKKTSVRMANNESIESQKCIICCDKNADTVLLPCNHGGVCFDCTNRIAKENPICYFCRERFQQVLRLELNTANDTDFLKVMDSINVSIAGTK